MKNLRYNYPIAGDVVMDGEHVRVNLKCQFKVTDVSHGTTVKVT
jgi:hypothetical protein